MTSKPPERPPDGRAGSTQTTLLSSRDIARILNCPMTTAYDKIRDMPHLKLGRLIRVRQEDFANYLEAHEIKRPPVSPEKSRALSALYEARRMARHGKA